MRRWLDIPAKDAEVLSAQWMSHLIRRACDNLAALSGKSLGKRGPIVGQEHLESALRERRGVLLVCLHNFATVPAKRLLRDMGYPVVTVRRIETPNALGRLASRWMGPRFHDLNEAMLSGPDAIGADDPGCALQIASRLRDGAIVDVAPDANSSATSVVVPFLKGRRPMSRGVVDLARLCGCPLLPFLAAYSGDGLRVEIGEPLSPADFPALIRELERQVRTYPDQWEKWLDPLAA
jgi:lauroyl/myristoyl acyltransferase